jgi:hypothetical protein
VTVETADVPRGEVVARVLRLVTTGEQDHAPDDGPEAEGR